MPLLELIGLRTEIRLKRSVVHALDGIDLSVEAGETLGIVGESGCGKTMTAMSIMQLLPNGGSVTGGQVLLEGRDLLTLAPDEMSTVRGNDIGMIFQDPTTSLNPTMTIGKQISESVRIHRHVSRKEAHERAVEALSLVGMPSPAQRALVYPHELSGGMRQRAMIAMALANEPKLLIADEPTTALDVTIQKQILELIDDLKHQLGMAVILVTHDLGVIAGRADKIAVMYAGKVVETTSTQALFANPRHPYTEALFASLPERGAESGERLYSIPGLPPDLTAPPAGCRFAMRCRYAVDACRSAEPPLTGNVPGHRYACILPVGRPGLHTEALPVAAATTGTPAAASRDSTLTEPLLRIDGLVKEYAVTSGLVLRRTVGTVSAVAGVSLTVHQGETLGLVGESGCGKTTVGKLIVGLETPTSGSLVFDGQDLAALPRTARRRVRRDVQLMFQDSYAAMNPRMLVSSIMREPLDIHRVDSQAERDRRIREIFELVGLPLSALERYPHEFSGGQRQRVGLARALALRPRLIVADEPVSALDVSIQSQVLNLMKDLQGELGLSYLFISHDLSVIRYLSDRIGVMYLGKLVEIGPAESVYSRPVHHYTRGLLDTIPVADPAVEKAKSSHGIAGELPSAIDPPSGCRFRTRCAAAQEICATTEPALTAYGPDNHLAACHFPLRAALGAEVSTAAG
ncbi:peptide/nickel transport system ATP-binding protein [Kitasatospora sp. MAP12-15]|uniref:ABC transporter ATP-binding protein n=1 Tax=unclassified Kitasatospora TaxID=2633591 RepID=UPI002476D3C5|nr:ABC transporter ATP-binding protein [Kitasatospora sp. MAP12-44]MDH6115010.1 peptide/nickel transport system ATP-binding protein [Kitasatospora sp. MAP12-44]